MNTLIDLLLMPPAMPLFLALLGIALVWVRRRTGLVLICTGTLLGYVLSMPLTAALLIGGLQQTEPVSAAQIAEFEPQWIVVLAGGKDLERPEWGGETLSKYSLQRLRYGARLARETQLPMLVSGGNTHEEGEAEGVLMRQALREEFGIQRVVAETESRNTRENAVNSAEALRANNATRILLVTQAAHMRRAEASFYRLGVSVLPAPTGYFNDEIDWSDPLIWLPSMPALEATRYALHERLGYRWYDWRGWVVDRRF